MNSARNGCGSANYVAGSLFVPTSNWPACASDPLTLEDESIFADSIEYIEGFIARWDRLN